MNIIDIGVVIFILFGALIGFKRGLTKELVKALGFIVIVILAYLLKNPLSIFFYEHLPFLKIGILKSSEVLNILIYEILAFLVALSILGIILKFVLMASSLFEKLLNATIILSIPSKILGAVVGIIHHYIIAFVILYVLTLTCFNTQLVSNSTLRIKIVDDTPILSSLVENSINVVEEFKSLKQKYDDKTISESEFNYDALELFLKYDLVKSSSVSKLIESGKITAFDNYNELLNKYKEK
jgi:uncharacterized membrane protein required for colicin V production